MLPKISPSIWALIARYTGTCCPALVLWMPTWWAVDAHATGIVGPTSGKYSIICMFRKHFENIVPFSEIIFVLLQAYSHYTTASNQKYKKVNLR